MCKPFVCNTYGIAPELLHLKDLEVNAIIEAQLHFFEQGPGWQFVAKNKKAAAVAAAFSVFGVIPEKESTRFRRKVQENLW